MYAIDEDKRPGETVTLYVSDPAKSQEFYQDLFGLVLHEQLGQRSSRVLHAPGAEKEPGVSLVLRSGAADGSMWLSVEVSTVSEVLDLYLLAAMMGAKAMLPRKRGERWSTLLTDPDGNRVSVWTRIDGGTTDDDADSYLRPRRWEWQVTPPRSGIFENDMTRSVASTRYEMQDCANVPGRSAAGTSPMDRRRNRAAGAKAHRGQTPDPTLSVDKTLESKE